jgi:succinate dehydrogenase flavin-adding protein (antitoxin of CptAB toxin-antitoxin module)
MRYLLKDRSMCDTGTCLELFNRYVDLVHEHIDTVEKNMYSELLRSSDENVNNVVKNFMSGSVEVKKIIKEFTRQWCPTKSHDELRIRDHEEFLKDTDKLFDLVLQRILDETEHLYPLVRNIKNAA